jgi:vacuolar-type H+-ATPase subunit C/Vma6
MQQARFYLAFARLQVLETKLMGADPFDKILAPKQREDLLSQLTDGLQAMSKGYGNDHILVCKARDLEGVFA